MNSFMMDTLDNRKVVIVNIPCAFLQGGWPHNKHPGYIMFEGIMVKIICKIDPSYYKNVIRSKDYMKKFLYGRLIKAVY